MAEIACRNLYLLIFYRQFLPDSLNSAEVPTVPGNDKLVFIKNMKTFFKQTWLGGYTIAHT